LKPWFFLSFLLFTRVAAADFSVGVARTNITPPLPFWLSGYAARTNPAPQVRTELWAKALAIADDRGTRVVMITADLIGVPRQLTDSVAANLHHQLSLPRSALLINASHTHAGPAIWPNLRVMFDLSPEDHEKTLAYSRHLVHALTSVASNALATLAPAQLAFGQGTAGFAVNRRQFTSEGVRIGANSAGPVDHDVPVLRITDLNDQLRALLFGYACHCTTLGANFYSIDADYAGNAQQRLEQEHPGATALFLALCGGDQNPNPRGTTDRIDQHGLTLATAVNKVLASNLRPIRHPLRTDYAIVPLDFSPHKRQTFEEELQSDHVFRRRRAQLMIEAYDRDDPVRQLPYPVQTIRFGSDLTLVGLGGEVVVDYALRLKKEYGPDRLIVAGYCNDVMAYVPSRRVFLEGGYEVLDSMIYYGQPGPLTEQVEESIINTVHQLLR
jgi:neutral ceramidase